MHVMRHVTKSAIIGIAVAGLLSTTASTASALPEFGVSPLDVDVSNLQPVESGALQVARIAPYSFGDAERWRVRAKVTVKNNEDKTIRLTKTYIGYPGGPGWVSADVKDTNEDPNIDSRDIAPGKKLEVNVEDGMGRSVGINRGLFFPVPATAQITLQFDDYSDRVTFKTGLHTYANKTSRGSYAFPGKAKDLDVKERWSARIHAFGADQQFGYDLDVSRWDSVQNRWTTLKLKTDGSGSEDGSKNSHHLIWGKPVYAMASGKIVRCTWSQPDNSKPGVRDSNLNGFTIDHGNGEIAQYAHLQAGTVNASLCPKNVAENTYGQNIPVAAGQFLGKVGNSGKQSTGPHLHVHVSLGVGGKLGYGVPLQFHGIRTVGDSGDKTTIGPGPFSYNVLGGMPAAPFNLIEPNPW